MPGFDVRDRRARGVSAPIGGAFNLAYESIGRRAVDERFARRPAFTFVDGDRVASWTYEEAWRTIERRARGLIASGLEPGERVLVRLPHSAEYAFAFFGANLAGLVPVPCSPQLTADEVAFLAGDSGARVAIVNAVAHVQGIETLLTPGDLDGSGDTPLPRTQAEDPAYLIYTSGTTARPKGVLHAQRVLLGRELMITGDWEGLSTADTTMHAGALNWSYTMGVGLMDPWLVGAHAILVAAGAGPETWPRLIEAFRITVFAAVPTVYRQMLKYGRPEDCDLSSLRHVLCAGEALPAGTAEAWRERVGVPMYEALGMTECSTYVSSGPAVPVRLGSPGRPQRGRRIAVLSEDGDRFAAAGEPGLLAIHRSDPGLMLGYWKRPDEEASVLRGEWFTGGDRASLDAEGYVWFHGRADDLIKSFGYRLSPVEIETALALCPGVAEVAVVGLGIDADKTLVTACVVRQEGSHLDRADLEAHAEQHLADYKRPHEYRFVEALPRTANGKVRRNELVARIREDAA